MAKDSLVKNWSNMNYIKVNDILRFVPHIDRSSVKKIVSVGSGISTTELLLMQYFSNSEIFLIDKEEISRPELLPDGECTPEIYRNRDNPRGFYHSWSVTEDAIKTSNLDKSRIHFLNPDDAWPDNVDLVLSSYSWCWAYLREVYWERAMRSLNIGGTLLLDIYRLEDTDVANEISVELGSQPERVEYLNTKTNKFKSVSPKLKDNESAPDDYFVQFFNPDIDGVYGGRYSWIRRK